MTRLIVSIVTIALIAICLTNLPWQFYPFYFAPILMRYQPFWLPQSSAYYFIYTGTLLIGSLIAVHYKPAHNTTILAVTTVLILPILNPILSLYLCIMPGILYLSTRQFVVNFLTQKGPNITHIARFTLWGIMGIGIPGLWVVMHPNWDFMRVIFLSLCIIKIGLYLYDHLVKNTQCSWVKTYLYFLFPIHFLILPSWIVCPFPSQFNPTPDRRENQNRGADWFGSGLIYFGMVILIGWLIHQFFGVYLTTYTVAPGSLIGQIIFRIVLGISKILFFFFMGDVITGYYQCFGYEMTVPIFNQPFLATHIFDFWNRFLIQTKEFLWIIFILPVFKIINSRIQNKKLCFGIAILIAFFIIDIPIHMIGVYDIRTSLTHNRFMSEWYLSLMGMFVLYFLSRRYLPRRIKTWGHTPIGKRLQSIFWICLLGYFY